MWPRVIATGPIVAVGETMAPMKPVTARRLAGAAPLAVTDQVATVMAPQPVVVTRQVAVVEKAAQTTPIPARHR